MKILSVVIPVYNEKDTILEILKRVEDAHIPGLSREIILVDDCSTDGTRDLLRKLNRVGVSASSTTIGWSVNYGRN